MKRDKLLMIIAAYKQKLCEQEQQIRELRKQIAKLSEEPTKIHSQF